MDQQNIVPPTPIAIPANLLSGDPTLAQATWERHLADCAADGRSPYGINRKNRRALAAQKRHATSKVRRELHEKYQAHAAKLRTFGTPENKAERGRNAFDRAVLGAARNGDAS